MKGFDLATFIDALFYVYYVLIIVRVLFSWIRLPSGQLLIIYRFVYDVTEPYLGLFRRIIPLMGPIDFSPFIGLIVLWIIKGIIHRLLVSGTL